MQRRPSSPIIRPASSRRPSRAQIRRRRLFVAFCLVAIVALVWFLLPGGSSPTRAGGHQGRSRSSGAVVAGHNPIKHVIFIIKENRTFNSYFATYGHGAVGTTVGKTLVCHGSAGCEPGADYPLHHAQDIQPHDITHGFSSGLDSIDGGRMDGFNVIGEGADMSGYVYFTRNAAARLLQVRGPFRPGRSLLHVDVRADVPRAPLHGGRAVLRDRRQHEQLDHPGTYCDDPTEYAPHFPFDKLTKADLAKIMGYEDNITLQPRGDLQDRGVLGADPHLRADQIACRTSCRQRTSRGSTTRRRTTG